MSHKPDPESTEDKIEGLAARIRRYSLTIAKVMVYTGIAVSLLWGPAGWTAGKWQEKRQKEEEAAQKERQAAQETAVGTQDNTTAIVEIKADVKDLKKGQADGFKAVNDRIDQMMLHFGIRGIAKDSKQP